MLMPDAMVLSKESPSDEDLEYLLTVFPEGSIKGCVVKAKIGADHSIIPKLDDHMSSKGPCKLVWLNTLILEDHETNSLLLIFQLCGLAPTKISDDLEVLEEHEIPVSFEIRTKKAWSTPLFEDHQGHDFLAKMHAPLKDQLSKATAMVKGEVDGSTDKSPQVGDSHAFLSSHYKKGGMIPVKELRKIREWKREDEKELEIKLVHMCKSCGKMARRGCCSEYCASNRIKIKMVIGWLADY